MFFMMLQWFQLKGEIQALRNLKEMESMIHNNKSFNAELDKLEREMEEQ